MSSANLIIGSRGRGGSFIIFLSRSAYAKKRLTHNRTNNFIGYLTSMKKRIINILHFISERADFMNILNTQGSAESLRWFGLTENFFPVKTLLTIVKKKWRFVHLFSSYTCHKIFVTHRQTDRQTFSKNSQIVFRTSQNA